MSGSITLHPKKGVNPHLTYCPRCGGEGRELVLLGNHDCKTLCEHCGTMNFGTRKGGTCGKCGKKMYNSKTEEIGDHEKLPGSLCEKCEKEIEQHDQIVAEGGVYFRCRDCKKNGVIRKSDFADAVRRAHGLTEPKEDGAFPPCGVEFSQSEGCPACGQKEE